MARNRKYRSAAIRFGPALKAFLLCLLIGGSGVGYVWQKSQINELGKQIAKREARLLELKDQNEKLNTQLNTMHLRRYLDQRFPFSAGITIADNGSTHQTLASAPLSRPAHQRP